MSENSESQPPQTSIQKHNKFSQLSQKFDPPRKLPFWVVLRSPVFVLCFYFRDFQSLRRVPSYAPWMLQIYLHESHRFMLNVGKYIPYMEHLRFFSQDLDRSPSYEHTDGCEASHFLKVMLMCAVANGNIPGVHTSLGQRRLVVLADRWGPEALDICLFGWRTRQKNNGT